MNIYIACALTHTPRNSFEHYVSFIHSLAQELRLSGCEQVTYALVNSDPQLAEKPFEERARLCYLWDRELVKQADLLIAEASFPSTGLGIELQIAEGMGIPIIICFKRSDLNRPDPIQYENPDHSRHILQIGEGYVSLMALGVPTVFKVISYRTEAEGIASIVGAVRLIKKG
jgi:hypothetical protein